VSGATGVIGLRIDLPETVDRSNRTSSISKRCPILLLADVVTPHRAVALIPAAIAIPALAAPALVSRVCWLVVAYEAIRYREPRTQVRHPASQPDANPSGLSEPAALADSGACVALVSAVCSLAAYEAIA
jgi:hypothetical protein